MQLTCAVSEAATFPLTTLCLWLTKFLPSLDDTASKNMLPHSGARIVRGIYRHEDITSTAAAPPPRR